MGAAVAIGQISHDPLAAVEGEQQPPGHQCRPDRQHQRRGPVRQRLGLTCKQPDRMCRQHVLHFQRIDQTRCHRVGSPDLREKIAPHYRRQGRQCPHCPRLDLEPVVVQHRHARHCLRPDHHYQRTVQAQGPGSAIAPKLVVTDLPSIARGHQIR